MNEIERQKLITTVLAREELRPLSRLERLLRSPWRTLPYYVLATAGHLKPFPITFQTLWKTKMTCYLPEGNTFYYYGYCEANLTNFFIRYIQEGMSVIDVGAHIGIYSMLSAELVGTDGHVYGFEPTPWTFEILKKNTKKLPNVTIFNQAISETKQFLTFSDYGPGYGAYNSAHAAGAADMHKVAKKISVSSISLDAFCQEKSIQPDLIKIDAEGFEYEVLKGTKAILEGKTSKRPLITIEVAGGDAWAENREQTFTLLATHQYIAYEINQNGLIAPHKLKNTYTYDNLLFVPQEQVEEMNKFSA